jgi:hypothetical protein
MPYDNFTGLNLIFFDTNQLVNNTYVVSDSGLAIRDTRSYYSGHTLLQNRVAKVLVDAGSSGNRNQNAGFITY